MATQKYPKIEYCIFDMDGLLVDTERIYTIVNREILARYGYEFTWKLKSGLMGKTAALAVQHIFDSCPGLSAHITPEEFRDQREEMQDELFRKVLPMQGAVELVEELKKKGVPIAVATGSHYAPFLTKTSHLPHLFDHFPKSCILTADSPEVPPGRGKPNPDIFLAAARALGRDVGTEEVGTEEQMRERAKGVVFEDAIPGVKAGVRAGMNVVWVPEPELLALDPEETYGSRVIFGNLGEFKLGEWGLGEEEGV